MDMSDKDKKFRGKGLYSQKNLLSRTYKDSANVNQTIKIERMHIKHYIEKKI